MSAISARYGVPCPACGAGAKEACRTLTTNRVTDTHKPRIDTWIRMEEVSARWGVPNDLSSIRAEGVAIGYSAKPMVLIQTPDGEQVWWASELTFVEETTDA